MDDEIFQFLTPLQKLLETMGNFEFITPVTLLLEGSYTTTTAKKLLFLKNLQEMESRTLPSFIRG